jgi:SAM-dependent methyltransferase
MQDATSRFGNRVEQYIRYRPGYPKAVLEFLQNELKLVPSSVVADVGSGTGISSELFLQNGNTVYGVEPNQEMRKAAESLLVRYSNFHSIDGRAEATGLQDHCVDFIVAGQAFHWFDRGLCRMEWSRILRKGGMVLLLWNDRKQETPFAEAYETLLRKYAIDYETVDHRHITPDVLKGFFGTAGFGVRMFYNEQVFDLEGLHGRVLSCSYMPPRGHPSFEPMIQSLTALFQQFEKNGTITMEYNTLLYYGML